MQCFFLTSVFTAGIVINIASYVSLQTPLCTYIEDAEIEPTGLVQSFFSKIHCGAFDKNKFCKAPCKCSKGDFYQNKVGI